MSEIRMFDLGYPKADLGHGSLSQFGLQQILFMRFRVAFILENIFHFSRFKNIKEY